MSWPAGRVLALFKGLAATRVIVPADVVYTQGLMLHYLLDTYNLWGADDTFTFPDGTTFNKANEYD